MTTQPIAKLPEIATPSQAPDPAQARRKKMTIALGAALAVAAVGYGSYWYTAGRFLVSTDDAYVAGNVIQVTPQVPVTVVSIQADDTNFVKAGTVLAQLDPADAQLAVEQAKTQLAQVVRQTESLYMNQAAQFANVSQHEAELTKARADLAHRVVLKGSGAVSEEEIRHAEDSVNTATAALATTRQ
jgi:membrane fusion protein, multidrug efflux system